MNESIAVTSQKFKTQKKQAELILVGEDILRNISEEFHNNLPLGSNLDPKLRGFEAMLESMGPEAMHRNSAASQYSFGREV